MRATNPDTKTKVESRIDTTSRYAAVLSFLEVGLGSFIHAFKIPLGGQAMSVNQGIVLSHATGSLRHKAGSAAIVISSIAAILKSLSPAGNKLGPMLSISAQGFLFALGVGVFGVNYLGIIVGMCLLSIWAFVQPFITLYLFFGHELFKAFDFYLIKMQESFGMASESLLILLIGVVAIKFVIASGLGVYFFRRPKQSLAYLDKFQKKPFSAIKIRGREQTSGAFDIIKLSLKDLFRPFFIVSFFLMMLFFWFSHSDWSQIIWLSLRPLAIAFLFFFVSRHPWFYGFINRLRKYPKFDNFFEAFDKTIDQLEARQK
jgi:hypothetical protein